MKLNKIILFTLAMLFLLSSASAIVVNPPAIVRDFTSPGTYYHSSGNLAYFAVDHVMTFTQVVVDSTYVEFNNTKFNISSPNRINISLDYLDSDMTAASGTTLVSFYAQTTSGNARFNISSFSVGATYEVFKNNVSMATPIANATGFIYFTNSVWSTAYFEIALLSGVLPTVTTNASTGVEETNATLNGYLNNAVSVPILYEHYNVADTGSQVFYGTSWRSETYTVAVNHTISSIKLLLGRLSTPGNIVLSIRATDILGCPTGSDLISCTTDGNTLPTVAPWEWRTFLLPTTINQINGTKYAIVLRAITGDNSHYVRWRGAGAGNPYANGTFCRSSDSGASWLSYGGEDAQFEVYDGGCFIKFQYGTTTAYGTNTTLQAKTTGQTFSQNIAGLTPGQLYHFRSIATNSNGTSYGSDMTLLTKPNEPLTLGGATSWPNYLVTFDKSPTANNTIIRAKLGSFPLSPLADVLIYNGTGTALPPIVHGPLTQGQIWYYRAWSWSNWSGWNVYSDDYISDGPIYIYASPQVTTNVSTGVEETNATLNGYLANNGSVYLIGLPDVTCRFQYGLTTAYGTTTANQIKTTPVTFNQNILGPTPGTLYHFRAVASNWNGTVYGIDRTFLTKPNEPTGLTVTDTAPGQQTLAWTHGTGYNKSVVRGTIGSYPATPQSGTAIQNSSANSVVRNGLTGGNDWYYRVWEYTVYGISFKFSDTYTQGHLNVLVTPTITTGAASLVEETTATLGGTLVSTGGDATGTVRFQYGLTTAYGTNTSNSIIGAGAFTKAIIGLTPGQRYHFRAYVNNTLFSALGADATFVTKPNAPDTASFTIVSNTRSLGLNWTKATGANTTLIVRKQGAYPLTKIDGTIIYNGTGSSYTNTGLTPGVGYGYRAWSYTVWNTTWQFSDLNASACEITKPEGATGGKASVLTIYLNSTMKVRLNWTKGTGANNTILVRNTNHLPTSWTDGTMIYNGTGISNDIYMPYVPGSTEYYNAWSYAAWIINPHLYEISANATTFVMPGGGLLINCFDENDHHNLTFNVKVSNQSGSAVYENTSCTNTLVINATLCPQGANIQIIVSATGYHQRIYTLDIYTGIIYLLNAYLPPETAPGNGTENCELRGYIDSMTITNHAVDAVVPLTYTLEDMISVEIYNASLYGTYGGWIFVSSDKYAFTTTSVTINETVLDVNTTMARVNYYYNFCTGGVESALYNLRVVETIVTSFSQVDQAVENVLVQIKRYINSTGTFVDVSSIFTDANGYINIYLVPDAHYKIFLNKTGYYDVIGEDLYPTPPNAAGQTEEKIFRIIKIAGGIPPPTYNPLQVITFNGYVDRATHILYVNYSDSLCATTDVNISVYEYNSSTNLSSLLGYFFTTSCNFQHGFNNINNSNRYTVVMNLNHTYFGHIIQSISFDAIAGWMALIAYTTPGYMNALWSANYGLNPFGWSNTIMFLLMVVVLFWGGRDEAPFGFIVLGLIFLIVNLGIGFYTLPTFGASLIPLTFIIAGILGAWRRYNG